MGETNKLPLPIDAHLARILDLFEKNSNLVLTAAPGSGKTTRVPPTLLNASSSKIIVLVPKRIAAIGAAARVAEENNWTLGEQVGYQVRFENKTSAHTQLVFMTEGVFIKKIGDAAFWSEVSTIIFDEFHERSSHLDLAFGVCVEKQILEQTPKIIVMSATLNAGKIKNFLGESASLDIEHRPFPLEIIKSKKAQRLSCDQMFMDQLVETLQKALSVSKRDILVFLPGLREMRFAERNLLTNFKNFEICMLHGSSSLEEQRKILRPSPIGARRIILSTNIAESSVTISSVDCVIDSGLEKKSVTENKIGFKRLELQRISQFSARQRAGRAARTSPGYCFEMWHESDDRSMPEQIVPEILSSDLLQESLTLLALGVKNLEQFSWLDKPKKSFNTALKQLTDWELIDEKLNITVKGQHVQSCPLDIERAVLFTELCERGLQAEAAHLMAFIETANFDSFTEPVQLDRLYLNDTGKKIESQLKRISTPVKSRSADLKTEMIKIFLKLFPNKVAKKKSGIQALSALGRGLEMANYLVNDKADYYLLLSGRELSSSTTKCDFAIGFSADEFEALSRESVSVKAEYGFDIEKRKIFKIESKRIGIFVINESPKSYVSEKDSGSVFLDFMKSNSDLLLNEHEAYKNYVTRLDFLKKRAPELGLAAGTFDFLNDFNEKLIEVLSDSVKSSDDFFNLNLRDILLFLTPGEVKSLLNALPLTFTLTNGKTVPVDYVSEQAPKISGRIQEFYGLAANPTVLNGRIRMTIELLAPNYRPTQVTSQLENFWKSSYFEIRKELKARYPKHVWPDDPANYKGPLRK